MRRLVLTLVLGLVLTAAVPASGGADIDLTQANLVELSCNDGHSVVLWADAATLTSLTGDVAAINSATSGLSCTLDASTVDPSTQSASWTVYDYNPSGQAIAPRNSPNKMPATTSGSMTTFPSCPASTRPC